MWQTDYFFCHIYSKAKAGRYVSVGIPSLSFVSKELICKHSEVWDQVSNSFLGHNMLSTNKVKTFRACRWGESCLWEGWILIIMPFSHWKYRFNKVKCYNHITSSFPIVITVTITMFHQQQHYNNTFFICWVIILEKGMGGGGYESM